MKFLSAFLSVALVFSLLTPIVSATNNSASSTFKSTDVSEILKQKTKSVKTLNGVNQITKYHTSKVDRKPELASESGIVDYEIDKRDLAFNREGSTDSAQITFTLEDYFGIHWIEVFDYLNPKGGPYRDGYLGYIYADFEIDPGPYKLDFAGEYMPWELNAEETLLLPDGVYDFDFLGENLSGEEEETTASLGAVFVKSTPSEIVSTEEHTSMNSTYEFTGKLIDKYIDYQAVLDQSGLGYDINTKITTTFKALDESGNVVSSGPVNLSQDGTFAFDVTGLEDGNNEVTISLTM